MSEPDPNLVLLPWSGSQRQVKSAMPEQALVSLHRKAVRGATASALRFVCLGAEHARALTDSVGVGEVATW